MYFLHKGVVKNGEKQEAVYGEDAIERYDFAQKKGKTELIATMNTPEKYIPYIADTFPNALDFIKLITESLINKLKIYRSVSHVL